MNGARTFLILMWAMLLVLGALAPGPAAAATLGVSPVSFDIEAPRTNAKLTLDNRGEQALNVQIRVFRWEKKNGADHLVPTKDVVASPPMARLKAGGKYTVRIVRVAAEPVTREESYRIIVDQLPQPSKARQPHVSFLVRQSIPVFFASGPRPRAPLTWLARIEGKELVLIATNEGSRRVRLTGIEAGAAAAPTPSNATLAGYVLAGSTTVWRRTAPAGLGPGSTLTIMAQDEYGPLEATAVVEAAR